MGQKVNPHGMRVGVIKDWDSRWFASKKDFGDTLVEDYNLREFVKKALYAAGIARIEIERLTDNKKVRVHIHCAKPGLIIGRGGTEIDKLRASIESASAHPLQSISSRSRTWIFPHSSLQRRSLLTSKTVYPSAAP